MKSEGISEENVKIIAAVREALEKYNPDRGEHEKEIEMFVVDRFNALKTNLTKTLLSLGMDVIISDTHLQIIIKSIC